MTETVTPRPINYSALKTEIGLPAYNGMADTQIIAAVNAKIIVAPITAMIPIAKIMNAFDATELLAMPSNQMAALNLLLRGDVLDVTANSSVRALLTAVFLDKPNSLAKLVTLVQAYDSATDLWVKVTLGIPAIVQADLVNARLA